MKNYQFNTKQLCLNQELLSWAAMSTLPLSAHVPQSPPASSSVPIQLALVDAGLPVEKKPLLSVQPSSGWSLCGRGTFKHSRHSSF